MVTSQGLLAASRRTGQDRRDPPLQPSEGARPCWHLHFGLLPSRAVRIHFSWVLSHLVCGHLLRQPQETRTRGQSHWVLKHFQDSFLSRDTFCHEWGSFSAVDFKNIYAQRESCELSFIWGKMSTAARETAFQTALRNCSEEARGGAGMYWSFTTKGR